MPDLIDPKTETLRTELLDRLEQAEFPITAWQTGHPRTLVQVDVATLAELYEIVSEIGRAGASTTQRARGSPARLQLAYRVTRIAATFAQHLRP